MGAGMLGPAGRRAPGVRRGPCGRLPRSLGAVRDGRGKVRAGSDGRRPGRRRPPGAARPDDRQRPD
eukprot:6717286-Pyramimonas_sp.AAC.1